MNYLLLVLFGSMTAISAYLGVSGESVDWLWLLQSPVWAWNFITRIRIMQIQKETRLIEAEIARLEREYESISSE